MTHRYRPSSPVKVYNGELFSSGSEDGSESPDDKEDRLTLDRPLRANALSLEVPSLQAVAQPPLPLPSSSSTTPPASWLMANQSTQSIASLQIGTSFLVARDGLSSISYTPTVSAETNAKSLSPIIESNADVAAILPTHFETYTLEDFQASRIASSEKSYSTSTAPAASSRDSPSSPEVPIPPGWIVTKASSDVEGRKRRVDSGFEETMDISGHETREETSSREAQSEVQADVQSPTHAEQPVSVKEYVSSFLQQAERSSSTNISNGWKVRHVTGKGSSTPSQTEQVRDAVPSLVNMIQDTIAAASNTKSLSHQDVATGKPKAISLDEYLQTRALGSRITCDKCGSVLSAEILELLEKGRSKPWAYPSIPKDQTSSLSHTSSQSNYKSTPLNGQKLDESIYSQDRPSGKIPYASDQLAAKYQTESIQSIPSGWKVTTAVLAVDGMHNETMSTTSGWVTGESPSMPPRLVASQRQAIGHSSQLTIQSFEHSEARSAVETPGTNLSSAYNPHTPGSSANSIAAGWIVNKITPSSSNLRDGSDSSQITTASKTSPAPYANQEAASDEYMMVGGWRVRKSALANQQHNQLTQTLNTQTTQETKVSASSALSPDRDAHITSSSEPPATHNGHLTNGISTQAYTGSKLPHESRSIDGIGWTSEEQINAVPKNSGWNVDALSVPSPANPRTPTRPGWSPQNSAAPLDRQLVPPFIKWQNKSGYDSTATNSIHGSSNSQDQSSSSSVASCPVASHSGWRITGQVNGSAPEHENTARLNLQDGTSTASVPDIPNAYKTASIPEYNKECPSLNHREPLQVNRSTSPTIKHGTSGWRVVSSDDSTAMPNVAKGTALTQHVTSMPSNDEVATNTNGSASSEEWRLGSTTMLERNAVDGWRMPAPSFSRPAH